MGRGKITLSGFCRRVKQFRANEYANPCVEIVLVHAGCVDSAGGREHHRLPQNPPLALEGASNDWLAPGPLRSDIPVVRWGLVLIGPGRKVPGPGPQLLLSPRSGRFWSGCL